MTYRPSKPGGRCEDCGQFEQRHNPDCVETCEECGREKVDLILCCSEARNFEAMLEHNNTCQGAFAEPPCLDCARRQLFLAEATGKRYQVDRILERCPQLKECTKTPGCYKQQHEDKCELSPF